MPKTVIYSTQICPYCVRAKNLLKKKNISYEEIMVNNPTIMEEMIQKAGGRRTVPQIFIGDTHIGGFDDLYASDQSGELDALIKESEKN